MCFQIRGHHTDLVAAFAQCVAGGHLSKSLPAAQRRSGWDLVVAFAQCAAGGHFSKSLPAAQGRSRQDLAAEFARNERLATNFWLAHPTRFQSAWFPVA